ncbi:MAG: hypothetical protein RIC03_13580 [Cyclobacteriaceae bacterium]
MLIDKVNKVLSDFIKARLSPQFSITSIKKDGDNWEATADVFEDSAFIQTVGLKTNAKDKNTYAFQLDDKFELIGFEKLNS